MCWSRAESTARRRHSSPGCCPRWGISHDLFDAADAASLRSRLTPKTRLVFVETISNPLLRVADLEGLAEVAASAGVPVVVDNTFAPLLCRPIARGATLVAHSATKMIGGHSDLTLGVLVGPRHDDRIDPDGGLNARTDRQPVRKLAGVARALDALRADGTREPHRARAGPAIRGTPKVKRTFYPGLESHPEFALAARLLDGGFGAMVTIDLGSRVRAESFIKSLSSSIPFAPSLGDVQTTLSHPATTSHRGQDEAQLAAQGLTAGMVRISVGLEDPEDLWSEFRGALDGLGS